MLQELPSYISIVFALTAMATVAIFHLAVKRSSNHSNWANYITGGIAIWMIIHGILALNGFFYTDLTSLPPKPFLLIGPPVVFIIILFSTKKGRAFIDDLPLQSLTWMHTVRVPVEMVLYWLFIYATIPEVLTFAGRNFDILAGLTAPLIAYFGIQKGKIGRMGLLTWNIICLALVLSVVSHAILAIPTPFQQIAFDQPNTGVLYFPFVWLPAVVVPLVFFGHFVAIRRLLRDYAPAPALSGSPSQP